MGKMEDTVGYARGGKEEQEEKAEVWAWLGQELQQARSMDKEVGCESAWVQEVGTCKVPNPMDEGRRRKKKSPYDESYYPAFRDILPIILLRFLNHMTRSLF